MIDLESIYRRTLELCRPELLVRAAVTADLPRNVVAIGKCAGGLVDGVDASDALVVLPRGYPGARHARRSTMFGGHPLPDDGSFEAGRRVIEFVEQHDDLLFLISGGGSACVEAPLEPWFTREDIITTHRRLLDAGISIAEMNVVRKHLSAIKGGRLGARARGRCVTLIYSDVATGDFSSVASGPTVPDASTKRDAIAILQRIGGCDRIVTALGDERVSGTVQSLGNATWSIIADNGTLVRAAAGVAAEAGLRPIVVEDQIESDVEDAAVLLAERVAAIGPGEVLIAGGEPTVVKRGSGKGGRCLELAARFSRLSAATALFASSDGVDGNSGVAGALVTGSTDAASIEDALRRSDTLSLTRRIGRPIIIPPTGNNLRDLYLLART